VALEVTSTYGALQIDFFTLHYITLQAQSDSISWQWQQQVKHTYFKNEGWHIWCSVFISVVS